MTDLLLHTISTDKLSLPLYTSKDLQVSVSRLDKIHPLVSGNKWFKLRYYLEDAVNQKKKTIVTYGGAWSNHILATAAACNRSGLNAIGIIRGEEPANLSATLSQAKELGMQLIFISRDNYQHKKKPGQLTGDDYYFIPEGGYGLKGAMGAASILEHCNKETYTHFCCAAGTGTMTAGLLLGSSPPDQIVSISVLKNNIELEKCIGQFAPGSKQRLDIHHGYHFGGYAKYNAALITFMNEFYTQTNIPSDFVYTGKLFYAVNDLVQTNYFPAGSSILMIHSGGLQGNNGLKKGTLIF